MKLHEHPEAKIPSFPATAQIAQTMPKESLTAGSGRRYLENEQCIFLAHPLANSLCTQQLSECSYYGWFVWN